MKTITRRQTDVLILGSGGAGLFAALHAHQAAPELKITVAVKGLLGKSGCTRMVQGGYNFALAAGDSIERHFMDTIEGGKWLPDQDLAWTLVTKAVERIHELENELGCFFDRNPDGTVHQKAFAGQTFDRTVHKGDQTGIEIINRLAEQVWARKIERMEEHRAIALIPNKAGDALAESSPCDLSQPFRQHGMVEIGRHDMAAIAHLGFNQEREIRCSGADGAGRTCRMSRLAVPNMRGAPSATCA